MSETKKKISVFSVIEIIFIIILVLVMLTMLAFNFLFKKDNSATTVFGYSFYNTKAVNMLPDFPQNTVVIAKKSEISNIKENSVILCNIGEHTTLIRVTQIQQEAGKTYYVVKFDTSSPNETFRIESDSVIAKAVWQINGFGAFLDFATSTAGIIIAMVIPLMFIIAIQVARILSIHRLEDEAAALDDIDDIIYSRNDENSTPVTFTSPRIIEDVTEKLPQISDRSRVTEQKDKILSVDNRGRAEYVERDINQDSNFPLFTYENIKKSEQASREPIAVGARQQVTREDLYMNTPTRITPDTDETEDFFEKYISKPQAANEINKEKNESVVFIPHLSNIIPESVSAVQEASVVAPSKKSGFDDSVKAYFEKNVTAEINNESDPAMEATIPEKAVVPKETIAPPKKSKSNKTLAELMSIIDAEENKLKK